MLRAKAMEEMKSDGAGRLFTAPPREAHGIDEGAMAEADGFRLATNLPGIALAGGWEEPEPERVFLAKA
jgi:hypothetical protein